MPTPRVLVLRAPGTNCDRETAHAFAQAGGEVSLVHINRLLEAPRISADFQILCIPGGFSYGDDVAAGRILANQIRHHLRDVLEECKAAQKLILGICNGFQVLIKSDVLLDASPQDGPPATLTFNDSGKYEDQVVNMTNEVVKAGIQSTPTFFIGKTSDMKKLSVPYPNQNRISGVQATNPVAPFKTAIDQILATVQ